MVILNEMAAAWSLYLSFGVILIFSNCACTEVTSGNEAAKKNDTSRTSDRNVWSTTTKQTKHSTTVGNTLKPSTPLPTSSDGLKNMVASENSTKEISASPIHTEQKNTTQVRPEIPANEHQSSVSRLSTIAYTTTSILRSNENRTKTDETQKDEKENLYIGFRNLFDAFKNVKKTTAESIENQFTKESVLSTTLAYERPKKNITSKKVRNVTTFSTPQHTDNSSTIWPTELAFTNVSSSKVPIMLTTTTKMSSRTSSPQLRTTTAKALLSTNKATPMFSRTQSTTRISEPNELEKTTTEPQNSTFDITSLRKKFVFIGNLTAANSTTEKAFLSIYDESTVSVETTSSRPSTTSSRPSTAFSRAPITSSRAPITFSSISSTSSRTSTTSTKKQETSTIYDLTFMDEAAISEPEISAENYADNSTISQLQSISVTTPTTVSSTNFLQILEHTFSTQSPSKKLPFNKTFAHENHVINKEHLQFPGITLKVSHVLIPKQKRSRYNIRDMKIEVPKNQLLGPPSAPTPKNSNCTRFPVQVVTASDTESKEKVNLTEEHYDCEYSPELNTTQKEPAAVPLHTYFGGYVFRYTLPKVPGNMSTSNQTNNHTIRSTAAPGAEDTDDYYSSYMEYSDPTNGSSSSGVEDGIFPDPDMSKTISETKSEALSIPLPDTSLADSDLHDHDVIDSVMYIYFGGATHGQRGAGRQIIIVGAVIALVAQFLTLASSIRRIKTHKGEEPTIILLNIETALTLTNLIFILGVQSTSDHTICKVIAASLYYLHVATLLWFLLSSVHSLQTVCQFKKPFKIYTYCIFGWITPFVVALLSYVFNERSFETNLYCWVSPLRGILISYILPVILLCIICIVLTVIGLKNVTDTTEDFDDTYSHKKLLRISAVALPLFSVIWFTGMVSLENSASLLFSLIFLISDTILNWLLFACWLPSEASQWKDMDEDYYDEEDDFDDEPVLVKRRFDDQPLLSELYEYGAQGQLYNLRVEPISIIST